MNFEPNLNLFENMNLIKLNIKNDAVRYGIFDVFHPYSLVIPKLVTCGTIATGGGVQGLCWPASLSPARIRRSPAARALPTPPFPYRTPGCWPRCWLGLQGQQLGRSLRRPLEPRPTPLLPSLAAAGAPWPAALSRFHFSDVHPWQRRRRGDCNWP
jgi:hypothetical protein